MKCKQKKDIVIFLHDSKKVKTGVTAQLVLACTYFILVRQVLLDELDTEYRWALKHIQNSV